VRGCALGLSIAAAACPVPLAAESAVAGGSGALSAGTRIDFRIVIPALLRVAQADDGVLRSSLRARHGVLSVSREDDDSRTMAPVEGDTGTAGTRSSRTPMTAGVYTIASP